jgi:hypothetical protein
MFFILVFALKDLRILEYRVELSLVLLKAKCVFTLGNGLKLNKISR